LFSSGSVFFPKFSKISCSLLFPSSSLVDFLSGLRSPSGFFKGRLFDSMKTPTIRCKCLHCKKLFVPDYRNRGRQKYCSDPECQAASKQGRVQARASLSEQVQDAFLAQLVENLALGNTPSLGGQHLDAHTALPELASAGFVG